jgi:predicted phosphodiesterase
MRFACFGGIYNNYLALDEAIRDARRRGIDRLYCLGDLGAFGPHPDRVFPLIHEHDVVCIQGNYDDSVGHERNDCQCGYTDPADNHFAAISYRYTLEHTSQPNREFLAQLPHQRRLDVDAHRVLFCHGSPRRTNEFLWESTSSTHFLNYLADQADADLLLATHTGIKWHRPLGVGRHFVNVGVLGRPENDGQTHVWYTLVELSKGQEPRIEFIPVAYNYRRLAREMAEEGLPAKFVETVMTGWWTTCLEVLPAKERRRGRY